MLQNYAFNISILVLLVSILINIFSSKSKLKLIYEFNTRFKIQFLIIILWSSYVFYLNNMFKIYDTNYNEKAKSATKHAIIALTISLCEHFDLSIQIYWIIWIVSFFLDDWV